MGVIRQITSQTSLGAGQTAESIGHLAPAGGGPAPFGRRLQAAGLRAGRRGDESLTNFPSNASARG
jgi:hypothetical protein